MKRADKKNESVASALGRVSATVLAVVQRQVTERGIVVWYDPTKTYANLVAHLALPGVSVLQFDGGFFGLREQLEPYLEFVTEDGALKPDADQPPALVVYIPLKRDESQFALIEAETAGVVLEPGAARPECNTQIGVLVERVFQVHRPLQATHLARQADEGLLNLVELDRMADDAGSTTAGTLQVVFGGASSEEILLQFVATDAKDTAIGEKNALQEVSDLAESELGMPSSGTDTTAALRIALRRYLLTADLLLRLTEEEMPETVRRLPLPVQPAHRDAVRRISHLWRNRLDLRTAYVEAADAVERANGLAGVDLPLPPLREADTFAFLDASWMTEAVRKMLGGDVATTLAIASARLPLFWALERPALQFEWKVIQTAAGVCLEAARVRQDLRKRKWSLDEMTQAYATHAEPWMRMDSTARQLETRYARLDTLDAVAPDLDKCVALARTQYAEVLHSLALIWGEVAASAAFETQRISRQTDIFAKSVRPALESGARTAFFLVDALRYEMAAELLEGLSADCSCAIEPVIGQLPGITTVGMAALLPDADKGLGLEGDTGGLAVTIGDKRFKTRQNRLEWMQTRAGVPVATYRLGEIVKLSPKRKKEIAEARLVIVTSQEIDRLGEEADDAEETRVYIDEVLEKLRRGIRSLIRADVRRFIITADHGFNFVEATDPGLVMDSPGGTTVELHSRVWIGRGGQSAQGFARFTAAAIELAGDLELAFPKGLGTFRIKGGTGPYCHGGLSPQEQILPLLQLTANPGGAPARSGGIKVTLSLAKARVTNRLFTVIVEATADGLFTEGEHRIRLEILSGKDEVGMAATAAYGFEEGTHEVILTPGKPNAVTLMISAATPPTAITIQAIDCATQVVLQSLKDVPVLFGV